MTAKTPAATAPRSSRTATPTTLNASVVRKLRQPFAPEHIRWKVQANPKENQGDTYAVVVVFVDARTVAAHLDDVVPGQWSTEYALPPVTVGFPALECRLTVCGVTRSDVGTVEPSPRADSDTKDLYSDALKRAAVQYGIGAFLYRFPQVRAKVEKYGNTWFITREAQAELQRLTEAVLSGAPQLPRFQALKVVGYTPGGLSGVTGGEEGPPPIGEERARGLHEQLGIALRQTDISTLDHSVFASRVLGFEVGSLAGLTEGEAATVYRAAKQRQAEAGSDQAAD
ncbi:Rad52/Rad22 family DNA repair protein [Deinococcus sonorensis]|uniref:Rad52/Rad22 family DNA repair protein n=2 Tax=Deinococcus sonorensis TaxID=309891 RepID=A0AAU7UF76_9DEIO